MISIIRRRSNDVEIKVGVRKWLVLESVVPPLLVEGLEALLDHQRPQEVSSFRALPSNKIGVVVGGQAKEIEVHTGKHGPIISVGNS